MNFLSSLPRINLYLVASFKCDQKGKKEMKKSVQLAARLWRRGIVEAHSSYMEDLLFPSGETDGRKK